MNRRGMTLIEILTVVAIAGMLAALGGPSFGESIKRRSASSAARQAMLAVRYARSQAIRSGKNVGIQFDRSKDEITIFTMNEPGIRENFRIGRHSPLRLLTGRRMRGEYKKDWPRGIRVAESSLVDRLGDLPGAFAELERKSCSFCASSGRVSIFATPKGQFLDFDGRILTGSFSVTGESDPRDETVWLSRVIAFNGFTGTIRTFTYKRGAWSSD
jgi:prepilin-type N-terminal cleavage/methylation domain-containing protein